MVRYSKKLLDKVAKYVNGKLLSKDKDDARPLQFFFFWFASAQENKVISDIDSIKRDKVAEN